MIEILFTSRLPAEFREELELLMSASARQNTFSADLASTAENYGAPTITVDRGFLRICVREQPTVQALYAIAKREAQQELAGVMVYLRTDLERIVLLHIAVKGEFSSTGKHAGELLTLRLIAELGEIARRLRGVRSVVLTDGSSAAQTIPLRAGSVHA